MYYFKREGCFGIKKQLLKRFLAPLSEEYCPGYCKVLPDQIMNYSRVDSLHAMPNR